MKALRNLAIGVALGAAVMASALDLPTRTINGKEYYYYDVPPKETIYSITRKFKVTREEIIRYNPQVQDGLRAGDVLYFPVNDRKGEERQAAQAEPAVKTDSAVTPVIEPEEVVEVAEVEVVDTVDHSAAADSVAVAVAEATGVAETETPAEADAEESEELNIAVMLPFMLDAPNMTRQVENHTGFYRGLLMAVDSLSSEGGLKVNVYAYDTQGSADTTALIMARPEIQRADFIIAPPDSLCIERIAAVADSLDACVVNLFAVKNDAHLRHESVMQGNIPHDAMYRSAVEGFCQLAAGSKVIVLNASDITADKEEFINLLTPALVQAGVPYETIDYTGKLMPENLEALAADGKYLFIPTSHSRESLMKILPALTEFNTANPGARVRLLGYPEWVVLRGDIKDKLHRLDTVVYSRFSTDLSGQNVQNLVNAYRRWFGTALPQSLPNTTLLGFDTAAWLISAAGKGVTEPYTGVQNTFRVVELEDGKGDVNSALYLINFMPSGQLNVKVL